MITDDNPLAADTGEIAAKATASEPITMAALEQIFREREEKMEQLWREREDKMLTAIEARLGRRPSLPISDAGFATGPLVLHSGPLHVQPVDLQHRVELDHVVTEARILEGSELAAELDTARAELARNTHSKDRAKDRARA